MAEVTTFRVFVSSTFKDLEAERNHLREHVYPDLRTMCAEHGARFQPIDLRWGVSREASLDQQAMNVCLEEIDRCREVTPRPNFLVLLGNRHGWLAPPPQVPADEFEALWAQVDGADGDLLDEWYVRDHNAVPPEYYLRPRTGKYTRDEVWAETEARLHDVLAAAAAAAGLADDPKYRASATEREILHGALDVTAVEGHAFCFVRELTDHPDPSTAADDAPVRDFVDPAQEPLEQLKARLRDELPYEEYEVAWDETEQRPSRAWLDRLADDVRSTLAAAIRAQLEEPIGPVVATAPQTRMTVEPVLDEEGRAHLAFAADRCRIFVGRESELDRIAAHLASGHDLLLVVAGAGGSGKSALLAEALRRAQGDHPDAQIVARFIGATAPSSDGRSLLQGLCRELARRAGDDPTEVPSDYQGLTTDFRERLVAAAGDGPLLVFLDSLDQLSPAEGARRLAWLPVSLPVNVHVVVSTRPEDTLRPLEDRRAPILELGAMRPSDGRELLERWLADVGRTLQSAEGQVQRPAQEEVVLDAFAASDGNPLYLRLAFEEARRWHSGEDPEELAHGVQGIIADNTFGRLAEEENHGEVLVAHALGYLAASRYGLAEDELLDLLSTDPDVYEWFVRSAHHVPPDLREFAREYRSEAADPELDTWLTAIRTDEDRLEELRAFLDAALGQGRPLRLPVVLWSRLRFDLRPYLTERESEQTPLIAFFHRELQDVAAAEFLTGRAADLHGRMAEYFLPERTDDGRPAWGEAAPRALSELPYHLVAAERFEEVEETLTDFDFLEEKASRVAVDIRTDAAGESTSTYNGVRRLQEDFDLALRAMGGGDDTDRPRVIVTATDFGDGFVVRCPHCNTVHSFAEPCAVCGTTHELDDWIGEELTCPNEDCGGPLRINPFTVGGGHEPRPAPPAEPAPPVAPAPEAVLAQEEAAEPAPDLPVATGATRLLREGDQADHTGVNHWLRALLQRHGPMAETLSPGLDARAVAATVDADLRAGEAGPSMSRDELVAAAARTARARGVTRVSERDLAVVILAAAGHEPAG